jgi:hypothetical protein
LGVALSFAQGLGLANGLFLDLAQFTALAGKRRQHASRSKGVFHSKRISQPTIMAIHQNAIRRIGGDAHRSPPVALGMPRCGGQHLIAADLPTQDTVRWPEGSERSSEDVLHLSPLAAPVIGPNKGHRQ